MAAAATVINSMAVRAFDDASLRPTPWAPRKSAGNNPLLRKSGTLRQSLHVKQDGRDSVSIGAGAPYAAIHQLGGTTSPHVIKAKNGKALHFGNTFAKSVNHPGSKIPARPFLPVLNDTLTPLAYEEIDQAVSVVIDAAGNGGAR